MYVSKRQATMHQGIATVVAIALVLWAVGAHMFTQTAEAANLTYVKDTLSNSAPSEASDHEIEFLSPTGVEAGGTITVTFPSGFTGTSSINEDDLDLLVSGVDRTVVDGAPGAGQWGLSWSGQVLTLDADAAQSIASNATVTIQIGTNADTDGTGIAQITNHSATSSYEFTVTAGATDSGQFRVSIIDDVLVTANVNTLFTFTVYGTTTSAVCNGAPATAVETTSVTIPFGTLNAGPGGRKTACQDLTVATNAIHGYVVTVEQDAQLLSSTAADIDGFIDGGWDSTPQAWQSPANDISDENTWGHWGLTSSDAVTPRTTEFGSAEWVAASTTPTVIMGHDGPADGTTDGKGRASIGYSIEITALQEAGDDYNTTLTYIATPTF